MSHIGYLVAAGQTNATGTTFVMTVTGYAPVGSVLVMAYSAESTGGASTPTVADSVGGNTWTRPAGATSVNGTIMQTDLFYCVLATALKKGDTITITDISRSTRNATVNRIRGTLAASPVDKVAVGSGTTVTAISTAATGALVQNNELAVVAVGTGFDKAITVTSPYLLMDEEGQSAPNRGVHLAFRTVTDGASQTYAGTMTSSSYSAVMVTFKFAAVGTSDPGPNLTAEPWEQVVLEAGELGGQPTEYLWAFVSATNGATIPLDGLGAAQISRLDRRTLRFTAPAILSTGTVMTFSLRSTVNGVLCAAVNVTVTVAPATDAVCTSTGPIVLKPVRLTKKTNPFPFVMPSKATMRAYAKKVTVNFFAQHIITIGNGGPTGVQPGPNLSTDYPSYHYLETRATEQSADNTDKGGVYRDRNAPRYPIASSNVTIPDSGTIGSGGTITTKSHRIEDSKTEIQSMIDAGVDIANYDMLAMTAVWNGGTLMYNYASGDTSHSYTCSELMYAAQQLDPGFKIRWWLDMSTGSSMQGLTPTEVAQMVIGKEQCYGAGSGTDVINKTASGAIILGAGAAEKWNASVTVAAQNWKAVIDYLATQGYKATVLPGYYSRSAASTIFRAQLAGNSSLGEPYLYGESDWGCNAPVASTPAISGDSANSHAASLKYQTPVRYSDLRVGAVTTGGPATYDDSHNSEAMRVQYGLAISEDADEVQYITWGDLSEQSTFFNSSQHGLSRLHLAAYYAVWFKTGTAPTIVQDAIYLSHRLHHTGCDTDPASGQNIFCRRRASGAPSMDRANNDVEAVVFLTSAATVNITVGATTTSFSGATGLNVFRANAAEDGVVSCEVVRAAAIVHQVTSPHVINNSPYRQDLGYYGTSSLAPTPPPRGMPVFPKNERQVIVTCTPTADTYTHQSEGAGVFHGTDPALAANGLTILTPFMRFQMPKPPVGRTLTAATLVLRARPTDGDSSQPFAVRMLPDASEGWNEATIDQPNKPVLTGYRSISSSDVTPLVADTDYTWTLNVATLAPLLGRDRTLYMHCTTSVSAVFYFHSSKHIDNGGSIPYNGYEPKLILTFS